MQPGSVCRGDGYSRRRVFRIARWSYSRLQGRRRYGSLGFLYWARISDGERRKGQRWLGGWAGRRGRQWDAVCEFGLLALRRHPRQRAACVLALARISWLTEPHLSVRILASPSQECYVSAA